MQIECKPWDAALLLLVILSCSGGGGGVTAPHPPPPVTGNLRGTVFDSSGGVLAGVSVTVARAGSNDSVIATSVSTAAGLYSFGGLPLDGVELRLSSGVPSRCLGGIHVWNANVTAGTTTSDVTVPCSPRVGFVVGQLVSSLGTTLAFNSIIVSATPAGSAAPTVFAGVQNGGGFLLENVVLKSGTIATPLTRVDNGYCLPTSTTYSGPVAENATDSVGVVPVTCTGQLKIVVVAGDGGAFGPSALYATVTPTGGAADTVQIDAPGSLAINGLAADGGVIQSLAFCRTQGGYAPPIVYTGLTTTPQLIVTATVFPC